MCVHIDVYVHTHVYVYIQAHYIKQCRRKHEFERERALEELEQRGGYDEKNLSVMFSKNKNL